MAEQKFKTELEALGFGGATPSPYTPKFTLDEVNKANMEAKARQKDASFFELVGERYSEAGTIPSVLSLIDRPDAEEAPTMLTQEDVDSVTEGITNERALKRVLDATQEKGITYGRAIADEVRRTDEVNKKLSQAGLKGLAATVAADVFAPDDAALMLTTAAATAAVAPAAAPVTALGAKAFSMFSKFKNNKKYLMAAAGIGGTELAGLELLRSQVKYDITGGDIMLAGALGAGFNLGFTRLGQVMTKRANVQMALRDQADGKVLTDTQQRLLQDNDDEILAQQFRKMALDSDDFKTGEAVVPDTSAGIKRKELSEMTEEEIAAIPKQRGVAPKLRGVLSSFVRAKDSDDGVVRWLADGLGLNSTGNRVDPATGNTIPVNFGALEQRDTMVMSYRAKVAVPIRTLRDDFIRRNPNITRSDFSVLVSRQIRMPNPNADKTIREAADIYKREINNIAKEAIGADAAGFTSGVISRIDNYVPRMFNKGNIARLRKETLPDEADGTINKAWGELAEAAIRRGQPEIERDVAKMLAKKRGKPVTNKQVKAFIASMSRGYIKNVVDPKYGGASAKLRNGDFDVEDFTMLMKNEGFDDADIEVMIDALTRSAEVKGHKRAKPRMILDEGTEITVTGADGKPFQLKFTDLLEENMENLYDSYVFQLAGATALARNGINTNKLGSSFDTLLGKVKDQADSTRQKEIDALQYMYDSVTGQLAYKSGLSDDALTITRRVREVSFFTSMGMSGMAALMETSNVLFEYSLTTLMKTVPQFRNLVRKAQNGELDNKLMREMMAVTGVGSDGMVSKVTTMRSRLEGDVASGMEIAGEITEMDVLLGRGRIFMSVASGLQGVTDILRRGTTLNYATEWSDAVRRGKVPFSPIKREQLGISNAVASDIGKMIRKHATYNKDGALDALNIDKWELQDAKNVFSMSARREATQLVQEMNNGSVNGLLRSEIGKTFFQFLSFPMASMEQQAMRLGVRFVNGDAQQVARIMAFSALMGSMMYMSRTYLNSMGRSDQQEYLQRNFQMDRFAQGALSQIGAASLFGYIYQLSTGAMDGNTNALTPAGVSLGIGAVKGVSDIFDAIGEGELTENELRSLLRVLPFSSLYGARQILNGLANAATTE